VQYGYYSTGVLDTLTYPSYGSVSSPEATYTYDDQGNMVSMEDWDSNITDFTYDADQNLKSTAFPTTNSGGSAVDNTYDPADNLTDTTVVDSEIWTTSPYKEDLTALTRNPDSLIATSTPAGGSESTLGYDASDRLQTGLGAEAYTYDSDSRLSTDTPYGGSATNYSYDTGSELCGSETSSSPSCTSPASGTTVYGYDSEGDRCYQATTTSPGSCSTPAGGSTLETYGWDQAGDLTCVTVANGSSATCASPNTSYTSTYVDNGDGLRVADTPAGGSLQQFTWDATTSAPRILKDGTNEYLYGPNSITPIEQINMSTGAVSYLVSDNQGVRMALASTGTSEGAESYDSYGVATGSTGSPFGFAGAYTDATKLVYLVHRYYDPASSAMLSIDPMMKVTSQPYSYSDDDPANLSDPTGLWTHGYCGATSGQAGISVSGLICMVTDAQGDLSIVGEGSFSGPPTTIDGLVSYWLGGGIASAGLNLYIFNTNAPDVQSLGSGQWSFQGAQLAVGFPLVGRVALGPSVTAVEQGSHSGFFFGVGAGVGVGGLPESISEGSYSFAEDSFTKDNGLKSVVMSKISALDSVVDSTINQLIHVVLPISFAWHTIGEGGIPGYQGGNTPTAPVRAGLLPCYSSPQTTGQSLT
jgi:RHS repeat-associated protein